MVRLVGQENDFREYNFVQAKKSSVGDGIVEEEVAVMRMGDDEGMNKALAVGKDICTLNHLCLEL